MNTLIKLIAVLFCLVLVCSASWGATQICNIPFEGNVTDSIGNCTVNFPTGISYPSGHTGYAGRTSHNSDDGNAEDMTITVAMPVSNEVYIARWVKYEAAYWGNNDANGCPSSWNAKQLWVDVDGDASTDIEMAIYGYNSGTGQGTWFTQIGGALSPTGNHYDLFSYTFGDWMYQEIYAKFVTGANASNVWVKINGTEIVNLTLTSTTSGASTLRSPGIKGTCDCDSGEGWWQVDDYKAWDGVPSTTSGSVTGPVRLYGTKFYR